MHHGLIILHLNSLIEHLSCSAFGFQRTDDDLRLAHTMDSFCLLTVTLKWARKTLLLLTSCEVHTANIRTAVLTYGLNEMRSVQKTRSVYFPYGRNNWLMRALLYSHQEVVGKFSQN